MDFGEILGGISNFQRRFPVLTEVRLPGMDLKDNVDVRFGQRSRFQAVGPKFLGLSQRRCRVSTTIVDVDVDVETDLSNGLGERNQFFTSLGAYLTSQEVECF